MSFKFICLEGIIIPAPNECNRERDVIRSKLRNRFAYTWKTKVKVNCYLKQNLKTSATGQNSLTILITSRQLKSQTKMRTILSKF
jgi:hypothetical protein